MLRAASKGSNENLFSTLFSASKWIFSPLVEPHLYPSFLRERGRSVYPSRIYIPIEIRLFAVSLRLTLMVMENNQRLLARQTLLIDADDTLWENNIYFERAIAAFIAFLDHRTLTPAEVRAVFNEVEHENTKKHGYGTASFERGLATCFERLTEKPLTEAHRQQIHTFAASVREHPIELLGTVAEALPLLAERHELILVTKGNLAEQTHKLEQSGLERYFHAVEVLHEKHRAAYQEVCERRALGVERTWMIGNSPKSDVNPALAVGLNAVYIHHPDTWVLEHAEIEAPQPGQQLLRLNAFGELLEWF